MAKIIGIAGSLRSDSLNAALLRAAVQVMPDNATLEVATIQDIPLYNGDIEKNQGIPPAVQELKERIAAGDALLLVTPEYNNSMPGVLKNTIDWLSRPPADSARVFAGRPVAIIGASPSGFGTILSQTAWLPVLASLGMRPWFGGRLRVSQAGTVFNEAGEMIDEKIRGHLAEFMQGFLDSLKPAA